MEWPLVTDLQMRAKHSGCRSQYWHTVKQAITELYKLNSEDPTACARRVEYLLEEDRFICLPGSYEVAFSHLSGLFLIAVRLNQSDPADSQSLLDSWQRRFRVRYWRNITLT